jgi:hypothetical protein
MGDYISVQNKAMLDALVNHEDGEIAFVEDEQSYYMYKNGWIPVKAEMTGEGLKLNLYDLNKQIINQLPDYDEEKLEDFKKAIEIWKGSKSDKFYLLYGKEISYFSLFVENEEDAEMGFADQVVDIIVNSFKSVKEYDITEDNSAVEIWVYDEELGDTTVMYLFCYGQGVVPYYG